MEKYPTLTNSASYIKYSYAPSTTPIITKHWIKEKWHQGDDIKDAIANPPPVLHKNAKKANWLEKTTGYGWKLRKFCINSTWLQVHWWLHRDSKRRKEQKVFQDLKYSKGAGADNFLTVGWSNFASHSPVRDLLLYSGKKWSLRVPHLRLKIAGLICPPTALKTQLGT